MKYRDDVHYHTLDYETYDAEHLLDSVIDKLDLTDDEALARALGVPAHDIIDIRAMRRPIDAAMLIRMHEVTGLDIDRLRNMLGDRRQKFRVDVLED
jgi:plasmid maintenance system antidote protein VapI